ncbi:MAG: aminoacyl-tRNA hydrolase [Bdellovibrionaceae bacterium]|nr:aminoacyl-tRNA hydrolase [Pseudobdellovibrionaceae bacterium]
MWLIVGLGNPGQKYSLKRHNIGFMAIDVLLNIYGKSASEKKEHSALTYHVNIGDTKAILCKPQTFMNLSGQSVRGICDFYKIPVQQIIALHDEVDFPFNTLKIQNQRGHGGHNGIRDIHAQMSSNYYFRFKLGVGRPDNHPDKGVSHMSVADYVLANFTAIEQAELPDFLKKAAEGVDYLIANGYNKAATKYNSKS